MPAPHRRSSTTAAQAGSRPRPPWAVEVDPIKSFKIVLIG
jgi:hypothetical protein